MREATAAELEEMRMKLPYGILYQKAWHFMDNCHNMLLFKTPEERDEVYFRMIESMDENGRPEYAKVERFTQQ